MGCAASVGQFDSQLPHRERSGDRLLSPISPSPSEKRASFKSNAITDDEHSLSTARIKPFPADQYQAPTENPSRLPSIELVLTDEEKHALELTISPVPVPSNECKRLKILKQSNILDTNTMDPEFDRFTSLAHRIFDVRTTL